MFMRPSAPPRGKITMPTSRSSKRLRAPAGACAAIHREHDSMVMEVIACRLSASTRFRNRPCQAPRAEAMEVVMNALEETFAVADPHPPGFLTTRIAAVPQAVIDQRVLHLLALARESAWICHRRYRPDSAAHALLCDLKPGGGSPPWSCTKRRNRVADKRLIEALRRWRCADRDRRSLGEESSSVTETVGRSRRATFQTIAPGGGLWCCRNLAPDGAW